jgi:hypothetical protein
MQHQTLENLRKIADVQPDRSAALPTRVERLTRWAELLERQPDKRLQTLHGTEYRPVEIRETMRNDHSPISVAFADPVLHAAGLQGDTYGDAKRFFELSDWQLHEVVCYCHFGDSMKASTAARVIRSAIGRSGPGLVSRVWHALFHRGEPVAAR